MIKQKVFKFKNIPGLYADEAGNFFFNNVPAKKVYNNGTLAIRTGKIKRGIKKLRTLAYVAFIEREELPF